MRPDRSSSGASAGQPNAQPMTILGFGMKVGRFEAVTKWEEVWWHQGTVQPNTRELVEDLEDSITWAVEAVLDELRDG